MLEAVVCSSCGARMRNYRTTCLRCGAPLPVPRASKTKQGARLLAPRVVSGIVAALALIVMGVVATNRVVPRTPGANPPSAPTTRPWTRALGRPPAASEAQRMAPPVADPEQLARIDYQGGDYQAAFERYEEATRRNPRDAESQSNCAQMLVRLGRPVEALPYFYRAIELNGHRWAYRFNLAHAYGVMGQWDRAAEQYSLASNLFPDDFATEYNLGVSLHKQGNEAAAVERFQRAIKLLPSEPDFYLSLGISSERLGRDAEAVQAYRRYLELAPAAPQAAAVKARVERLGHSSAG